MAGEREWCAEIKKSLGRIGLGECWVTEGVGAVLEWKRRVKAAILAREDSDWRWGILRQGRRPKVKLVDYTRMKYRPEKEWFLSESQCASETVGETTSRG